jgi:hypothetical protein
VFMTSQIQLQTWLTDARKQYHLLATGKQAKVLVDQNGERIEYSVASMTRLASYIADLERQLGQGTPLGPMRTFL